MLIKNYAYTIFYQMFSIIVPIVTMPYISRILSPASIGEVNYTYSIAQVFVMLAMLGITKYGVKSIAQESDGDNTDIKTFVENYIVQVVIGLLVLSVYIIFGILNEKNVLYYIQSIYIIATIFDINWFYQGKEDFKKSVTRGIFVKIAGLILIFFIVKQESDVIKYALSLGISQFLGTLALHLYFLKDYHFINKVREIKVEKSRVLNNLIESIKVFIPLLSLQIGVYLYPIIIGYFGFKEDVAYFNNSIRIVMIPLYIITSLSTVLMPRVSRLIADNKDERYLNNILKQTFNSMMILAIPLSLGIFLVASNFIFWFFGESFIESTSYLQILSIKIVPMTIIDYIAYQYLIPRDKNSIYSILTFIGTIIGLGLSFIFLDLFGVIGFAVAATVTDFTIMILLISKSLDLFKNIMSIEIIKFMISGGFSFFIVSVIDVKSIVSTAILVTIIEVLLFSIIYFMMLFILKSRFFIETSRYIFSKIEKTS